MNKFWRIVWMLFCSLLAFIASSLAGFGLSFLFGANIHDMWPGIIGLIFGTGGALWTFLFMRNSGRE